jgi:3-oxoacyl-[acyl-carrier protein] reductase
VLVPSDRASISETNQPLRPGLRSPPRNSEELTSSLQMVCLPQSAETHLPLRCHLYIASPLLHDATKEAWEKSFQADILGLIALIDAATPHLAKRGGTGSIVVVSSLAGFEARERNIAGPYGTLKRAQATLAKDYARKLGPLGVRINSIAPGMIETRSVTLPDGTVELSTFQRARKEKPEYIKTLLESVPLGRTGTVEDAANVVVFLGSRLSGYVCGANLIIDGGMSIGF